MQNVSGQVSETRKDWREEEGCILITNSLSVSLCSISPLSTGSSHLNLILVVEDFKRFSVFYDLCALFKLELKQRVGYNANPNVYRLDIILDIRDRFLNVLKWCIIRELLASVVNLALDGGEAIVDLL